MNQDEMNAAWDRMMDLAKARRKPGERYQRGDGSWWEKPADGGPVRRVKVEPTAAHRQDPLVRWLVQSMQRSTDGFVTNRGSDSEERRAAVERGLLVPHRSGARLKLTHAGVQALRASGYAPTDLALQRAGVKLEGA